MELWTAAARIAAALAVGLLIGLERGWRDRQLPAGGRVAGLRTFALIALLGALLGLDDRSAWPAGLGLVSVGLLFVISFGRASDSAGTLSITTAVAGLVTYALGVLAGRGELALAVGTATVVALLLDLKEELHEGMRRISPAEMTAVLQLSVLSAAVLPLLPNRGFGPYEALNPFQIWLAVILIAALSLAGHVAARWRGPEQGLLWVGLLGGLASSTAATLALARSARTAPELARPAAAGIVAASGVMFLRMAVVTTLLQPRLALQLALPLALLGGVAFVVTAWQWRGLRGGPQARIAAEPRLFDLRSAIGFGALLAVVAVLVRFAKEALGEAGLYGVAFVSGVADVDAILVSTLQLQAKGEVGAAVAMVAILLAVLANTLVKAGMAWGIAGRAVGLRVALGFAVVAVAGAALAAWRWLGTPPA